MSGSNSKSIGKKHRLEELSTAAKKRRKTLTCVKEEEEEEEKAEPEEEGEGENEKEEEEEGDNAASEASANRLVSEMTVAITGVPQSTTLIGVRNVTRGTLVRYAPARPIGPPRSNLSIVRRFPELWQRSRLSFPSHLLCCSSF
jgi:pyruvate/2-oxoglutarate dehydrogenase complex dihydrolipoamide acyltransferase (E2) component